jgi:hypothetical protein
MATDVRVEFGVLGPLLVRRGAGRLPVPPGKQRALLAALLLAANQVVSHDALIDTLWGAELPGLRSTPRSPSFRRHPGRQARQRRSAVSSRRVFSHRMVTVVNVWSGVTIDCLDPQRVALPFRINRATSFLARRTICGALGHLAVERHRDIDRHAEVASDR